MGRDNQQIKLETGESIDIVDGASFLLEISLGIGTLAGQKMAGKVFTRGNGVADVEVPVVKIKSENAVKGTIEYDLLNSPASRSPNTRYVLESGTSFKTNSTGQVEELTFTPVSSKVPRDSRQTEAGKQGRDSDVGGHAQACSQGGLAMATIYSRRIRILITYKVFYENEMRRALNDPQRTVGPTTIQFNRTNPNSPRPDSLTVTYTIDGKTRTRVFENEANSAPKEL